jgi:hypothetical protein
LGGRLAILSIIIPPYIETTLFCHAISPVIIFQVL